MYSWGDVEGQRPSTNHERMEDKVNDSHTYFDAESWRQIAYDTNPIASFLHDWRNCGYAYRRKLSPTAYCRMIAEFEPYVQLIDDEISTQRHIVLMQCASHDF
ncbi:uncharacterized protein LOC113548946 [Rhopalosiphum maidis]|uniref:uncharacterized protein LOC113548946 n=1 Tax=Rhopalosiphum maidis TaxID=43146 RepID=UPI000F0011C9|nr:uncharacterized protein LOC113548946 [Rhopalosiphum maidis]